MGKISFTTDMWSDFNKKAYMAVTAHWLEKASLEASNRLQPKISLCTDLIGFVYVPSSHTEEHLAGVFLSVINCLKIAKKVFF